VQRLRITRIALHNNNRPRTDRRGCLDVLQTYAEADAQCLSASVRRRSSRWNAGAASRSHLSCAMFGGAAPSTTFCNPVMPRRLTIADWWARTPLEKPFSLCTRLLACRRQQRQLVHLCRLPPNIRFLLQAALSRVWCCYRRGCPTQLTMRALVFTCPPPFPSPPPPAGQMAAQCQDHALRQLRGQATPRVAGTIALTSAACACHTSVFAHTQMSHASLNFSGLCATHELMANLSCVPHAFGPSAPLLC
jgi:hypothetical protein